MANRAKNDSANPATWCPECGPSVPIDEDGLCAACGATAIGPGADLALNALASVSREKARADAAEAKVKELETERDAARDGLVKEHDAREAAEEERDEARGEVEYAYREGGALYDAKIAQAEAERAHDEAIVRTRELEAQCAAMRRSISDWMRIIPEDHPAIRDEASLILSSDAGRAMMERVEALERVAEEADATAVAADPSSSLWAALHALRALEPKR